jgi:hypothetical protein
VINKIYKRGILLEAMKKKGAIELSIGTIVVVVLAISMLMLGLVLIGKIRAGTTESIDTITRNLQSQISILLVDERADVVVYLKDRTASIKPDTDLFGIAIGAKTKDGSVTDRTRLQYMLKLDESERNSCIDVLGREGTKNLFKTGLETWHEFGQYDGAISFTILSLTIPKGTASCSQTVFIDVRDTKTNQNVGGTFFKVHVQKPIFGLF